MSAFENVFHLWDRSESQFLEHRARALLREGRLNLPEAGGGQTPKRHLALFDFGCENLSLAKVVEGHIDALSILKQAGRYGVSADTLYAVWASDAPGGRTELRRSGHNIVLTGRKRYCTGATFIDRALITAHGDGGIWICDVPVDQQKVIMETAEWASPAFAGTQTATLTFQDLVLSPQEVLGSPGWYLSRSGFWHGAIGPASCWAGGAAGLFKRADEVVSRTNPFAVAHLAAMHAEVYGMRALLVQAGMEIDHHGFHDAPAAKRRALTVRHLIEQSCQLVLQEFGRATGPGLLAFDSEVMQRTVELTLYVRQVHGEADLIESLPPRESCKP
jgi:alkylation response protein AidB-like acyl-CoA dehydrogenase